MRAPSRLFGVAVLLFVAPILGYANLSDADLQKEYAGKVLTLRHFLPGNHLRFDSSGNPASPVEPGPWTVYGQLRVQDISLRDGTVRIKAQRLFLFYDTKTRGWRDFGTLPKIGKSYRKWIAQNGSVEVEVECGTTQASMPDAIKAMNATFLVSDDQFDEVVPDYWKTWVRLNKETGEQDIKTVGSTEQNILKVGGSISAPRVRYDSDPEYTDAARMAKFQGTTILWVVVDPSGVPKDIRIERALGMGLDDEAVKSVQSWGFDPAKKEGSPVAVQINVEVNFRLY